jgi:hypothetical protein
MRLVKIFDIPTCRYSLFNVSFQRHLAGAGMTYIGRKAVGPLAAKLQPFASTPITIIFIRRTGVIFAKLE